MKNQSLKERFQQLAGIKPLYEQEDPRRPKDIEFDNAQAMDRLTPDDKDKMGKIQQMMDKERGMDLNAVQYEKAEFVYSEGNGRFYALNLYTSDGQKTKLGLTQYDEANEWLKDRLRELGIEASHNEYDFS